jgi:CO dehydrogenase maturation factor
MPYVLAITGKGGTGKTTVSACLIRKLMDRGIQPVLADDADPNSTHAPLVGLIPGPTISDIREEVLKEKSHITGVPKERILSMKLEESVLESDGFDLLTMGRPEGPTCYCYVNTLLRGALSTLKSNYRVTVVDNEAGMEHLSRMNTETVDCLVLVCEPTMISARAAQRICQLSTELSVAVRRRVLVWNKVRGGKVPEVAEKLLEGMGIDETIYLPDDDNVAQLSATEQSVFDTPLSEAYDKLLDASVVGIKEPQKKEG